MRLTIFTAFLLLIASVSGFDLKCTVKSGYFLYVSTINYCQVDSMPITTPDQTITSVNGATTPTAIEGLKFQSSAQFSYLPKGIGTFFPALRELHTYANGLKSIEAAVLDNLTALEALTVGSNLITQLPNDLFKDTPKLRVLYFSNNQIEFVGKDLLTNLKSLTKVYFQSNKCINSYTESDVETFKETLRKQCADPVEKYCSDDFKRYEKKIEELEAENEKLKHNSYCYNGLLDSSTKLLHEESRKLKKCKNTETSAQLVEGSEIIVNVLDTTDNEISIGMAVASPETKITKIQDASGNDVKPNQTELVINQQSTLFLPTNLGQFFPSIQRLSVTFSGLYRIDAKSFLKMKQLTAVNFTGNKLVEITEAAFSELTSLKDLDLSNNNLEVINENAFKSNVNLEIVWLNDNKLEIIDGQLFSNHNKLQKLFLQQNRLKYINANLLTSLDSLEVVDFTGNSCINLSHPKSTLKEITTAISDNCIASIEVTCKAEIVDYQLNEVDCEVKELILVQPAKLMLNISDSEKKIEKFLVISQKMFFIPIKLYETFPSLVQLHIEQSQLTTLQKTDFEGLSLLRELTIERNNISRIDEGVFDAIPLITHLNLANNKIQLLSPKAFAKLMKMKVLILKGNQLKKFSARLLPPKQNVIKHLQLQENKLEFIDSKVLRLLRNAEVIDLTNNKCINVKYQQSDPQGKTLMDLTGIIEFECADDSEED